MPKSTLKTHLQTLSKEQIIEVVLELYDNMKPVKEYFEFYLSPNEKEMLERYRAVIVAEFYPSGRNGFPKTRFSVAKKAISDFRNLKPAPELLADLMLTLPELACKLAYECGGMTEQYSISTPNNFKVALEYMRKNNLLNRFKPRCQDCLNYASNCGYGLEDDISEIYHAYYGN